MAINLIAISVRYSTCWTRKNELFDTQRAMVSAQTDLVKAQATVLSELGVLTDSLDAKGFNSDKLEAVELDLRAETTSRSKHVRRWCAEHCDRSGGNFRTVECARKCVR